MQIVRVVCVIALVGTVLLGCASAPAESPGLASVRRVVLSSSAPAGGEYQSDTLYSGAPTDRFDAHQQRGYLYVIFNDNGAHTIQFTVKRVDTGAVFATLPRMETKGRLGAQQWHGASAHFQIAGRLRPGDYVLDLTIDDLAAGKYPFTVSDGVPPR
jgi:hypothetical protein